jgi:uncharacterized protein (DUF488 family)
MDGILVLTIGHSARSLESFIELLRLNEVTTVTDVRTIPRSRKNPQFNKDTFPASLAQANIDYQHMPALGGLRHTRRDSPNIGWENASFRGYADYMQTEEFEQGLADLIDLAGKSRVVVMCAEVVPWRCHRWLIADALVIRGIGVEHIISRTSRRIHTLTTFAHVTDGRISYPVQP